MAKQNVNIGDSANDGAGDPLRVAFDKINDNFDEVYTALGGAIDGLAENDLKGNVLADDDTIIINSTFGTINLNGTINTHIIPRGTGLSDIGSAANKFKDLYINGKLIVGDQSVAILPGGEIAESYALKEVRDFVDWPPFYEVKPGETDTGVIYIAWDLTEYIIRVDNAFPETQNRVRRIKLGSTVERIDFDTEELLQTTTVTSYVREEVFENYIEFTFDVADSGPRTQKNWFGSPSSVTGDSKNLWTYETITGLPLDLAAYDDTKLYVLSDTGGGLVNQINYTNDDIETGTFSGSASVAGDGNTTGMHIDESGNYLFTIDETTGVVRKYNFGTAGDITTITEDTNAAYDSVLTEDTAPRSIFLTIDGLAMIITGNQNKSVYQYNLSTAWDPSTATYSGNLLDMNLIDGPILNPGEFNTSLRHIAINPDGRKLHITTTNDYVYYEDISTREWWLEDDGISLFQAQNFWRFEQGFSDSGGWTYNGSGSKKFYIYQTQTKAIYQSSTNYSISPEAPEITEWINVSLGASVPNAEEVAYSPTTEADWSDKGLTVPGTLNEALDSIASTFTDDPVITEVDPVFTASPANGIEAADITNWDAAHGWGDHGAAGYVSLAVLKQALAEATCFEDFQAFIAAL